MNYGWLANGNILVFLSGNGYDFGGCGKKRKDIEDVGDTVNLQEKENVKVKLSNKQGRYISKVGTLHRQYPAESTKIHVTTENPALYRPAARNIVLFTGITEKQSSTCKHI